MYLRMSEVSDAEPIFQLVADSPYIARYQYWARGTSLEAVRTGIVERVEAMRKGMSAQYRLIVPEDERYEGIVGTVTAYDYEPAAHRAKVGYYQSADSQGHGYMIAAVRTLVGQMRATWGIKTVEFEIEDSNERSINLVQKLGALKTEQFNDSEADGKMIPNRVWRLDV